jgi:hypothetical protein
MIDIINKIVGIRLDGKDNKAYNEEATAAYI